MAKENVPSQASNLRYIVRIINKDVDGSINIQRALTQIKGIGLRMSRIISEKFALETGLSPTAPIGMLTESQDKILEEIALNPKKHGLPDWLLNRQKDWETGTTSHLVLNELDFSKRKDLQRLNEIKSYRGLRLSWGLTVRGQRTRSTHRGKGPVVGVSKKDAKKGGGGGGKSAPAAPAESKGKK